MTFFSCLSRVLCVFNVPNSSFHSGQRIWIGGRSFIADFSRLSYVIYTFKRCPMTHLPSFKLISFTFYTQDFYEHIFLTCVLFCELKVNKSDYITLNSNVIFKTHFQNRCYDKTNYSPANGAKARLLDRSGLPYLSVTPPTGDDVRTATQSCRRK